MFRTFSKGWPWIIRIYVNIFSYRNIALNKIAFSLKLSEEKIIYFWIKIECNYKLAMQWITWIVLNLYELCEEVGV